MDIPLDKLSDLGGVFIIALLLMKIIWNDLKHLNASAERMEEKLNSLEKHADESKGYLAQIASKHQ